MASRIFCFSLMLLSLTCHAVHQPSCCSDSKNTQAILQDINAYRKHRGLNPLQLRADLCREAQKHSSDMATHRIDFGHTGFPNRVKHIYAHSERPNGAAENVAYNYHDGHDVVKNWLTSPHHLANIKGHYNYTGIGLARDTHGKLYFTQIFLQVG